MKFKRVITGLLASLVLLFAVPSQAATLYTVERARTHTTAGAIGNVGGALTTCTNASPIVCTSTSAHALADGDQVQVTGVATNTAANGTWFAKVTTYSATTFGLYSDVGLGTASTGSGAGTGGAVSQAYDISTITGDWTFRVNVESLTSAKKLLISIQDSTDGFVSDIRTLAVVNTVGLINFNQTSGSQTFSWRAYQLPSARFGTSGGRIRLYVQAIDGSATALTSFFVEY